MSKPGSRYYLDYVIILSFLVMAATGSLSFFYFCDDRFPKNHHFAGIAEDVWLQIHFWAVFIFIASFLIHILLHWKWFVAHMKHGLKKIRGKK